MIKNPIKIIKTNLSDVFLLIFNWLSLKGVSEMGLLFFIDWLINLVYQRFFT